MEIAHVSKVLAFGVALMGAVGSACAEPYAYMLDVKRSNVAFFYDLGGLATKGHFPISEADVTVDLANVSASEVRVRIATEFARAGGAFATMAMRSPDLLHTGAYPYAEFISHTVSRSATGARILGDLTLRGQTRPIVLEAKFMREADAPLDNSKLVLRIEGGVNRSDYGVTGFQKLVGDRINLGFLVYLDRDAVTQ